jgi:hypothetical protein
MVKHHFVDPTNVVLVIQTERKFAGFFCWCGDFFTPVSFQDFSFDAPNTVLDTSSQLPPSPRTKARFALPDLTIGQSYIYRAVLATGLAILTAVLMRPTTTILKPRPNESIAQPAVLTSSSRLELRGNRVDSEQRVDGKSAPKLPSPAGTTRPKPLRSLPQQFAASGRAAINPQPQKRAIG